MPYHGIHPLLPLLICCGCAGTLYCRPRALRGVSVLSRWTMSTLANASVDSRGQPCESLFPSLYFLHCMSVSFCLSCFPQRDCLPSLWLVCWLELRAWKAKGMGVICVLSHISGSRGIQCTTADKMNKQLGSLERRHCVIITLISL